MKIAVRLVLKLKLDFLSSSLFNDYFEYILFTLSDISWTLQSLACVCMYT